MANDKYELNRDEKKLRRKYIVVTLLIIAFFIGVIFVYYSKLYNEKRENMIKDGRIAAMESADQIDRYLSTNMDSINLAAYALDEMIREHRTDKEIQDYLVDQSTAVRSAVLENMTGLYGYINGRFFSGTNWVPPADYDATIRPWYTLPMENPGELTILDPYIDVQSGNVMLAVGKTLCDGVSVISVDVSLDRIQDLTEKAVANGETDIEMLLSDKGVVVAHSDSGEIGKNYYDEKNTLGARIVENIETDDDNCFEIDFGGDHYIVYVEDFRSGWHCISVEDATDTLGTLTQIFISTIVVIFVITVVIGIIMARSNRYLRMSERAMSESEAKSVFLAQVSHEIRTPINAMMGNNEMILRETRDDTIRGYSDNVKSAGTHLLKIVDEILAYSKTGQKPDAKAEETVKERERYTAPTARVLAVDDNPMNLQVFLNLVKQTRISVDTADSGREAVKLAETNVYDVLVLDHMMPEKDGIETLAEIRTGPKSLNVSTPAVCLTANAIPGAREFYIGAGFDDYLTKPVDPNALEDMLRVYIPEEKIEEYVADSEAEETGSRDEIPNELEALRGGVMDIDVGLKNNGSIESYMSILKMFYSSVDDCTEQLARFLSEGDDENYTIKIHALKSSLRVIGATDLSEQAQRLETAGKTGDREYIDANHMQFISRYLALRDSLSGLFPKKDDSNKPEAGSVLMKDTYQQVAEAAEEMDCDRLDEIFTKMEDYRIPKEEEELFEKIRTASERFDYESILKLLDRPGD